MSLNAASWLLTIGMITFFVLRGARANSYKAPRIREAKPVPPLSWRGLIIHLVIGIPLIAIGLMILYRPH